MIQWLCFSLFSLGNNNSTRVRNKLFFFLDLIKENEARTCLCFRAMQKNFEAVKPDGKERGEREYKQSSSRNLFSLPNEMLLMIFSSKALTSLDLMALELTCSTFRKESLPEQAAKIKLNNLSTQDLPAFMNYKSLLFYLRDNTSLPSFSCSKCKWKTGGFRYASNFHFYLVPFE